MSIRTSLVPNTPDIRSTFGMFLGSAEDVDSESNEVRLKKLHMLVAIGRGSLSGSSKFLEVGCGSGVFFNFVREQGIPAVGVDARPRGNYNGALTAARIERLPFADETFDVVLSSVVFDRGAYTHNHKEMIGEIARVLKKGGLYISRGDMIQTRVEGLRRIRIGLGDIVHKLYKK
jgi:SAM-dependent methyltransferase